MKKNNVVDSMARHVIEALGRTEVVVEVGKVVEIGLRRVGVTLCSAEDARILRERCGQRAAPFAVHRRANREGGHRAVRALWHGYRLRLHACPERGERPGGDAGRV